MKENSIPGRSATARFNIGDIVKHRVYPFRGVVFDVDPVFANTDEWLQSIPAELRPHREQPFYHLLAENAETTYVAYVSEQNLLPDDSGRPCRHPLLRDMFDKPEAGTYRLKAGRPN
ncbi:heat shock protein HspQ [Dongia mobilis]|jgi:heat shock protein HspQ|uniref:heat shock protein HspQ n=1 Tax=Dongia sp. TaxID=1977262 RepID=UPI0026EDFCBB